MRRWTMMAVCGAVCGWVLAVCGVMLLANDRGLGPVWNSPGQVVACTMVCDDSGSTCDFDLQLRDRQGVVVQSEQFRDVPYRASRTIVYTGGERIVSCDQEGDDSSDVRDPSWTVLDLRGDLQAMGTNNDSSSSSDEDSRDGVLGPIRRSYFQTPICMTKCDEDSASCGFTIEIVDEHGESVATQTFDDVPSLGSRALVYSGLSRQITCRFVDHSGETEEDAAVVLDRFGKVVAYMTATE